MLFMCQGKPQPGLAAEEQKKALELFAAWKPPAGLEIKAHYLAASGGDFVVVETDSVATLIEATATWAPFVAYEVTPIVVVQDGVGGLARGEQARSKLI